jgi:MFS family permease
MAKKKDDRWYYTFLPYNVGGGATSPMIPLFVTEGLKGTVAQVGIISAITSVASVPANIIWGNLSDTTKKRKVFVLIGFLGLAIALALMGLSMDMGTYYFANFIQGAIAAAAAPVSTVLILEIFAKNEWAKRIGDFSKVAGIGWVAGLILGTLWLSIATNAGSTEVAMRALFLISSALCVLSVILAVKWVPEPEKKIDRSEIVTVTKVPAISFERGRYAPTRLMHIIRISAKNLSPVNFTRNLKVYYAVVLLAFTGFLTFYVGFPIFLTQTVGLSVSEVFVVYVASALVSAMTYSLAGKWTGTFGGKRMQELAFAGRILLFPAVFLLTLLDLPHLALLVLLCALHSLIGFCWANLSVAGNTIVCNLAYCEFRTESLGMYNAIQGIGTIIGSLLGGFVANYYGYLPTFIIASVFVGIALVALIFLDVEKVPCEGEGPKASRV